VQISSLYCPLWRQTVPTALVPTCKLQCNVPKQALLVLQMTTPVKRCTSLATLYAQLPLTAAVSTLRLCQQPYVYNNSVDSFTELCNSSSSIQVSDYAEIVYLQPFSDHVYAALYMRTMLSLIWVSLCDVPCLLV
jgi:hypothetical protein